MCRSETSVDVSRVPLSFFLAIRWGGLCFSRQFNDLQVVSHLSHLFSIRACAMCCFSLLCFLFFFYMYLCGQVG